MPSSLLSRFHLRSCGAALAAGAALATGGVHSAHAGAFSLSDQSPSAVALSFAGSAAMAEDPSTIFFNPAGMAFLDGFQTESSYTYVRPRAEFDNQGSRYSFGSPIRGGDGGGGARGASFGDTYLTAPVLKSEKYGQLNLGIGITVPFGEVVDYDPNWVGRYQSLRSSLRTTDYGFSAAYRWKFLSVGAGFDAMTSSAVLSNSIDFGLAGFAAGIPGYLPGNHDATVRLEGTDVEYGYNVGGIVEYLQPGQIPFLGRGRIGVSYRSGITQKYDGYVTFRNVPLPFKASGAFNGQPATADLKLPESYHFSFEQAFAKKFNLLGDVTWTRWGRLQQIPINFSVPASQASLVSDTTLGNPGIANRFQDTLRITGGFEYAMNDNLTLRLGGGWDESPVPNQFFRNTRIPDGDRYLLSTGLRYHAFGFNSPFLRNVRVDTDIEFAYLHLFVHDPQINTVDTSGHSLVGKYNEQVNIFTAALIFRYGAQEASRMPEAKDAKDRSK